MPLGSGQYILVYLPNRQNALSTFSTARFPTRGPPYQLPASALCSPAVADGEDTACATIAGGGRRRFPVVARLVAERSTAVLVTTGARTLAPDRPARAATQVGQHKLPTHRYDTISLIRSLFVLRDRLLVEGKVTK